MGTVRIIGFIGSGQLGQFNEPDRANKDESTQARTLCGGNNPYELV